MASQEIVDGLRAALNKGENLMQAMMSFYNAGYKKQDVEEAARMLSQPQQPQTQMQNSGQTPAQQTQSKKQFQPGQPVQRVSQYISQQPRQPTLPMQATPQQSTQQVSAYESQGKPTGSMITIVLVIMLIILIAILVSLFLFRDVITSFLGGLTRVLFRWINIH